MCKNTQEEYRHEAVEMCPECMAEVTVPDWAPSDGYRTTCPDCGESMLLCDECLHAEDNPLQYCDWDKDTCECFRDKQARAGDIQMPEPDGEMVRNRLAKLFSDEIEETESEIANEKIWAWGCLNSEDNPHWQNIANLQSYLESLQEMRDTYSEEY